MTTSQPISDLRTRAVEAAKDAFADECRDGVRLLTDERLRRPWTALDDALAAAWKVLAPYVDKTPAGAPPAPADPATDRRELAELDRIRAALAKLADEMDAEAADMHRLSYIWHTVGDDATARVVRVRGEMWRDGAARLRALLEEK